MKWMPDLFRDPQRCMPVLLGKVGMPVVGEAVGDVDVRSRFTYRIAYLSGDGEGVDEQIECLMPLISCTLNERQRRQAVDFALAVAGFASQRQRPVARGKGLVVPADRAVQRR